MTRAALLAQLFNEAEKRHRRRRHVGKSTVTGNGRLDPPRLGRDPTVMNGAVMKNFVSDDQALRQRAGGGRPDFVSEVDESDGSISSTSQGGDPQQRHARHKSLDELRSMFGDFAGKSGTAVLNSRPTRPRRLARLCRQRG
jgi:UDP-N-acetylmuramate--alanine ligase